jgi:hypothetical protein
MKDSCPSSASHASPRNGGPTRELSQNNVTHAPPGLFADL